MKYDPTEQQRAAITTADKHLCVDAGAGSGKTTVLVDRIVHLLLGDVPLRQIVAITFTRKAAAEMRERLRRKVHEAADPNNPKSMTKWRELEYQVESARITTIDSFCAGLLRENALHLGIDPDFVLLADAEVDILRGETSSRAVEALLEDGDPATHRLAEEFGVYALIEFMNGALRAPAALDRAKTDYAGLDVPGLVQRWSSDADEIQRRRRAILQGDPAVIRMLRELHALDGFCADAAEAREITRREMVAALETIHTGDNDSATRDALARLTRVGFKTGSKKAWTSETAFKTVATIGADVRSFAREYDDPDSDPAVEERAAQLTSDVLHVYVRVLADFADAKSGRTAMDFSDLLTRTVGMVSSRKDVRDRVARGIKHLLVDEFQDTNHAQLDLAVQLSRLSGRIGAELFVVGDAKQSIYRFRNAEVEVFDEARNRMDATLPLDENFRSVPEIIAFINEFFERSGMLHAVEPKLHRLIAKRKPAGEIRVEFLVPTEIDGDDDTTIAAYREREAELIAARIAQLCAPDGARVFDKDTTSDRPARFGDVALLLRTLSNAEIYDAALRRLGIPSVVVEGAGFYARQEVLDLHNLFAAALDPWNEFALAAFLRGPLGGVSDDTLMELTRDRGLAEAVMSNQAPANAEQAAKARAARELLADVWHRREMPLAALVRHVLARTGFEAILLSQYHGAQKAGNLRKLVDLAENFSHTGRATLAAFTDYLAVVARRELREGDAELLADADGAVVLMTVHKAKGLEFPIVAVADTAAQPGGSRGTIVCHQHHRHGMAAVMHDTNGAVLKPRLATLLNVVERDEESAEEARVLYVAMTRARDHLLISAPPVKRKGSWAARFNDEFEIFSREHGEEWEGLGWKARVLRSISGKRAIRPAADTLALDLDTLRAQAGPIAPTAFPAATVPISELLDRMFAVDDRSGRASHPGAGDGLSGQSIGNAVHALMERWDFSSDPPIDAIVQSCCPRLSHRDALRAVLESMASKLRTSGLWPILSESQDVQREVPFVWRAGNTTLRGKIDVLLNGECVVDYKTGRFNTEKHARYEAQLQLYAAAAIAAGRPVTRAYVYYMESAQCMAVDVSAAAVSATTGRLVAALTPAGN